MGPSVTTADLDACKGRAGVIVINDQWQRAPWADAIYSGDVSFWHRAGPTLTFTGARYACTREAAVWGATVLDRIPGVGWSDDPHTVYTGSHSGFQAIQLAAKLGATKILLLGYDMHPSNANPHRFARWLATYPVLATETAKRHIRVVNCSPQSVLDCFPRQPIQEAL